MELDLLPRVEPGLHAASNLVMCIHCTIGVIQLITNSQKTSIQLNN